MHKFRKKRLSLHNAVTMELVWLLLSDLWYRIFKRPNEYFSFKAYESAFDKNAAMTKWEKELHGLDINK